MTKQTKLPRGWKEVKLGDIFIFEKKSGRKAGEGSETGKYKFFTSSSKQSKFIDNSDYNGEHLIFSSGGQEAVHYCNEKFSASNDCFIVKVDDKVLTKYIFYYIFSKMWLLAEGFKGAGLEHISKDYLTRIKIIYPESKETQKKIVQILEKAEQAKKKRENADKLTQEYLKSVFYEMFYNEGFKEVELGDIAEFIRGPFGGSLKKEIFKKDGYLIYEQYHPINNDFSFGRYFVDQEKFNEMKRFEVKSGDLLISCSGTMGKIAIVPGSHKKGIINQALLKLTLDKNKLINLFLKFLLETSEMQNRYFSNQAGTAIQNVVSVKILKQIKIPLPPLSLQQKFASIVEEIEKLKEKQKQSKEGINVMFDSLMQRTFNGELVA